jgi:hypothetical protein
MLYKRVAMKSELLPTSAASSVFYSQWAYWCTLAIAAFSYAHLPQGGIRTALLLTPVLPALLVGAVSYWIYRACDEYIRLRILSVVVITGLVLAALTLGYFFLEMFGLPRLSMIWVNLVGWSIFNLQMLFVVLRSR